MAFETAGTGTAAAWEALEPRFALGVDLAAIKLLPLILVLISEKRAADFGSFLLLSG
jgi:hypothetical protein